MTAAAGAMPAAHAYQNPASSAFLGFSERGVGVGAYASSVPARMR
jgi:hypothetical protein